MSGDASTGPVGFGLTNSQMSIASNSNSLNGYILDFGAFISMKGTNVCEILSKPKEPF